MTSSTPFDQLEGGINLISSIDRQINAIHSVETEKGNLQFGGEHLSLKRRGHANDVLQFAAGELGAKALNHQSSRGTRSQAQHHAVLDLIHRGGCHRLFHLGLKIHRLSSAKGWRDRSKGFTPSLAMGPA